MNGQKQRNALPAVERALSALGGGKPEGAPRTVARAVELDQLGLYGSLAGAIEAAAADLQTRGAVTEQSCDAIAAALGPGPLAAAVASLRGS